MGNLTRRTLLQMPAAAAILAKAATPPAKLQARPSKAIAASPLSIGFETLDRKMFDPERTYTHLANLGVKWARCQTGWARTEQVKGEFNFGWLDAVVDNLLNISIQPWFNLGYGNLLYTPGAAHESAVGWAPLNSPEARQAWLRYVEKIAEHFGSRVRHWEIWNEPNISGFWQPEKPDPARYVELVKITAPVIRKRIPGCTIIGGAFAGLSAFDYFERCFDAGLADHVDKVTYHPYRAQPEWNYASELAALRGLIARYKPGIAVWQGENGAPSTNNSAGALRDLQWDETRQAKWLLRRILIDLILNLELTSYFHTVDMVNYVWSSGQSGQTNAKGLLRGSEYTPKPSYYAYQNVCALFDAETKRADLLMRFDRGASPEQEMAIQSGAFVRRGYAMYTWWLPVSLQREFSPGKARIAVWSGAGARLENPVTVDLLSGDVLEPAKALRSGGYWTFDAAPVRDCPLLIADSAVVTGPRA